jgi:acetyltransferase-like isoleucine patch superfamily enzyme
MNIKEKVKASPILKKIAIWLLTPEGQARPRLWIKLFVNPFVHERGKGAKIQRRTRMDLLPTNSFHIGNYSTIEDFCTINNGVGNIQIGNQTRIGISSVLIGPVTIGDDVRLAQNVVVTGLNHNYQDVSIPISEQGVNTEQVYIGDETWIGANAVILPGVFIGKHCVIAAGSVLTKNIPSNSVVTGNPAKIIKQYNSETEKWEKVNK